MLKCCLTGILCLAFLKMHWDRIKIHVGLRLRNVFTLHDYLSEEDAFHLPAVASNIRILTNF